MKTKLSPLYAGLRGKMGNIVASDGRGGPYIRSRIIPFNPKSVDQVAARARLSVFSQGWASLTDGQRILWNAAVDAWKNSDVFGEKLTPSGFNLYCALNCNLDLISEAPITTPPALVAVPALTALSATQVHAGATTITFTPTPLTAGSAYVLMATAPMSQGRSSAFSEYRVIQIIAAGQTSPRVVTTAYNAKFGGPGLAGEKVFFKVYAIELATGRKGADVTCMAIVS